MARDYKHAKRRDERKPVPGWVWLATGLMIGLLIALLVYLWQQPAVDTPPAPEIQKADNKKVVKKIRKTTQDKSGLRYEFYTLLPESEVVIPEQEIEQKRSKTPAQNYQYRLQVGSFQRIQEADTLRARLALLGIESSVHAVELNGETWHRVLVGPMTSLRDINTIRNRLQKNNINNILVRSR